MTNPDSYNNTPMQEPQKTAKRKGLRIFLILLVLLASLAIAAGIVLSRPKVVVAMSLKSAVKDLVEREEIAPLLALTKNGSAEFKAQSKNAEFSGKVYVDLDTSRVFAQNFTLKAGDAYTASAYAGLDQIWIKTSDNLFGNYGVAAGNIAVSVKLFLKNNGLFEAEDFESVRPMLEMYDDGLVKEFVEDYKEAYTEAQKKKLELAMEIGEFSGERKEKKIGRERMKVRVFTLTLDEYALQDLDYEYYLYLSESKTIRSFLGKYEELFITLLGGDADFGDVDMLFDDYIDDRLVNIPTYQNIRYAIQLNTKPYLNELLSLSVSHQGSNGTTFTDLYIETDGQSIDKTQKFDLCFDGLCLEYEIIKNTESDFRANIIIDDYTELQFVYNKSRGNYSLKISELDEGIAKPEEIGVAQGRITQGGAETIISLQSLTLYGEETDLTAQLTLNTNDPMPNISASFKDISTISSEDIQRMESKSQGFLRNLWYTLEEIFYS